MLSFMFDSSQVIHENSLQNWHSRQVGTWQSRRVYLFALFISMTNNQIFQFKSDVKIYLTSLRKLGGEEEAIGKERKHCIFFTKQSENVLGKTLSEFISTWFWISQNEQFRTYCWLITLKILQISELRFQHLSF